MSFFAMNRWPDDFDRWVLIVFFTVLLSLVGSGYVLMFFDLRAWWLAARRVMIVVSNYLPQIPAWARQKTPPCLLTFGLRLPCSEEDLLKAYREKVKKLHPDKGGDRQKFLNLQASFEQAQTFLRGLAAVENAPPLG
ncbi:MAG: J domain-containing protein [Pirellulales bacterium]|nr:J domain-containing protein [Pirellulales bacterium]